jgi:hypothetical protein
LFTFRALEKALIGNFIYMANKPLISETNHTTEQKKVETNKKTKYVVKVLGMNGYILFFPS